MAPVTKASLSIARCSSQDPIHRAENILIKGKKWLSNKQDKSGRIEAEIHLSKAIQIGFINIGNAGSAFVELLVGSSMWLSGKEFVSLLPSTMLMSPADCKMGKKSDTVKMLDKDAFEKGLPRGEWDRLRVICRQPYNKDKQFGLQFIDIIADDKQSYDGVSQASDESKTSPRQSLAQFRSKLQTVCSPSSRSESRPPSIGQFSSPPSNRAAGLVQAALKGQVKPKNILPEKKHHQRHSNKPKRNSPYQVDAQLQRRKSLSRRTAGDIEDEVECFLEAFDFEKLPLEAITYRHLKEQMEAIRGCELTKQEKKIFLRLAEKAVLEVLDKRRAEDQERKQDVLDPVEIQTEDEELQESIFDNTDIVINPFPKTTQTCPPPQSRDPPVQSCGPVTQARDPPIKPHAPRTPIADTPTTQSSTPHIQQTPSLNSDTLLQCPICEKLFSRETIEFHASTCGGDVHETVILTSPTRNSDVEEVKIYSPVKTA